MRVGDGNLRPVAERLVVIGGDAAGMSAATNARRGRPDLEIVALEQGRHTAYSACGIPYVVGGQVDDLDTLVVRTPQEFRDLHRIDVRTRHRVVGVDIDARRLEIRALDQDRTLRLGFDQLVLATGARPVRPPLPGIDQDWIHGVQTLTDAAGLLDVVRAGEVRDVVIVGAGYIGLEMAEAFIDRGARVTLVEQAEHPLGVVDPEIGTRVAGVLDRYGVTVRCGVGVTAFGDHVVETTDGDLPADVAVLGTGVRPNAELLTGVGVTAGAKGAVRVDHRQRTSADGIWAAGDCADTFHLVTRERVHIALGTVANKTGRIAGLNIGGTYATFPGVLGTAVTRICEVEIARTGVDVAEAEAAGIEVVVGEATSTSRAGYFPGAAEVVVRLVFEASRGRLVGGQLIGADRIGKRIDVIATAITGGLTAADLVDLDLAYAPPIATTWDPFQIAARNAQRALIARAR